MLCDLHLPVARSGQLKVGSSCRCAERRGGSALSTWQREAVFR